MAWLRNFDYLCRKCHKKPAVVELMGRGNESFGKFCQKCGDERLKKQLEYEKQELQRLQRNK